jgi:alkyl hydroperoxide reductase subunit AhpC
MKIGETAPDFDAETTQGRIRFHDWIGDSWAVLFHTRKTSLRCAPPNSAIWLG